MPFAYGHYIENLGNEPLVFLEMFRNPLFQDVSAAQWMANLPPQVSADALNMPRDRGAAEGQASGHRLSTESPRARAGPWALLVTPAGGRAGCGRCARRCPRGRTGRRGCPACGRPAR
ncbi:hypothetical protein [Nonomuraea maritima]|uniref:hypothetical protein n=1 Tax=Nonomuraea maritima TaxID=683260 RepID=UPI003718E0AA